MKLIGLVALLPGVVWGLRVDEDDEVARLASGVLEAGAPEGREMTIEDSEAADLLGTVPGVELPPPPLVLQEDTTVTLAAHPGDHPTSSDRTADATPMPTVQAPEPEPEDWTPGKDPDLLIEQTHTRGTEYIC